MDFSEPGHQLERVQLNPPVDFEHLTEKAIQTAERVPAHVAHLLRLLADCEPVALLEPEQERGASYSRLERIAELAGMYGNERTYWYKVAEAIPLTDRHAARMLNKLERRVL